ncbi:Endochitinase [Nymphon striatum]|nr:Endochitinase [Nymphon striatum]
MAGNNARRNVFTNNVLKWVRKFGFDGLVLHWNQPGRKERNSYINLLQVSSKKFQEIFVEVHCPQDMVALTIKVREIRSQFSPDNIILNTVLSIDKDILRNNYDLKRLNELVDQFYAIPEGRISMESEFTQTLNPLRSPSDSLNMIDGLQNIVDAGIPRHKILSGISFQGSSFTLASTKYHGVGSPIKTWIGGGNEGAYTKTRGLLSYYEICSGLQKKRLEPGFDSEAFAPYAFKKDQWIAYEDENSVSIKVILLSEMVDSLESFFGPIDMDDFRGFCGNKNPLLNAINKTFDGYRVSIQDSEILEAPSAPTPTLTPFATTLTDPTIPTSNPSASDSSTIDPFFSAAASLASLGSGLLTTTNSNDESGVNVFIPNDIKVNCTTATRKFIAHPVFCSRYYQCIHGVAVPQVTSRA